LIDALVNFPPESATDSSSVLYSQAGLPEVDMRSLQPLLLAQIAIFNEDPAACQYIWRHIMPRCADWFAKHVEWGLKSSEGTPAFEAYSIYFSK